MHSTLVVTPAGLPLGLLTQEIWVRVGYKPESARERKNTAIEEKESYRWIAALQETVEVSPSATTVVTLCDREAPSLSYGRPGIDTLSTRTTRACGRWWKPKP